MSDDANKGAPASVTLATIEGLIGFEQTEVFGGVLTVHVIRLKNGFMVTGESACADPAKFDAALGREYAREDAIRKIWGLEGYLLRERLYQQWREDHGIGRAQ